MNNDLISRSALKAKAETVTLWNGDVRRFVSYETIDNAPTVNPSLNLDNITEEDVEKFKMIWQRATNKGLPVTIEERQRGKWIDRMADEGYVECPYCHKQITGGDLNFCVKCGAEMQKGDET